MRKKGKEEKEGKREIGRTEYRRGRKRKGNMSKYMSRSIYVKHTHCFKKISSTVYWKKTTKN